MLYELIYTSKSENLMSPAGLKQLLEVSRLNNRKSGITGMLLYVQGKFGHDVAGRFIQVLEGTEQEVEKVFDRICDDHRHAEILVLKERLIEARNFEGWDMGFKTAAAEEFEEVSGFFELGENFLEGDRGSRPLEFLKSFYRMSLGKV